VSLNTDIVTGSTKGSRLKTGYDVLVETLESTAAKRASLSS
jgi:hypothetical protein